MHAAASGHRARSLFSVVISLTQFFMRGSASALLRIFRGNNPLADSRYRVFAKLLDDRMIERWLRGDRFTAS